MTFDEWLEKYMIDHGCLCGECITPKDLAQAAFDAGESAGYKEGVNYAWQEYGL